MLVYIAGPLTNGHRETNVQNAKAVGFDLMSKYEGVVSFVPHLWDTMPQETYDYWMEKCLLTVTHHADCVVLLPGYSPGAVTEVEEAMRVEKPVFKMVHGPGGYEFADGGESFERFRTYCRESEDWRG